MNHRIDVKAYGGLLLHVFISSTLFGLCVLGSGAGDIGPNGQQIPEPPPYGPASCIEKNPGFPETLYANPEAIKQQCKERCLEFLSDESSCKKAKSCKWKNNGKCKKRGSCSIKTLLQDGGNTVYIRHGTTENEYADQILPQLDLDDCSTQRVISKFGWDQMLDVHKAFTSVKNIHVGTVTSSNYCRAWQSASLAFNKYEENSDLNFFNVDVMSPAQIKKMRIRMQPILSKMPDKGFNDMIVGHDDQFEAATGIYPEPQGIGYLLRPNGKNFEVFGCVLPQDWYPVFHEGECGHVKC